MDKNYKPVYVRGTETGKGVIEALEALGGINDYKYTGNSEFNIYYISPDNNFIVLASSNSPFGSYVKATAEEIKPLRWRAARDRAYYTIESTITVIESIEYGDRYDDDRYKCGNYFRTREEAQEIAEKIKKILLPD